MKLRRLRYSGNLVVLVLRSVFTFQAFLNYKNLDTEQQLTIDERIDGFIARGQHMFNIKKWESDQNNGLESFLLNQNGLSGGQTLSSNNSISLNEIVSSITIPETSEWFVSTKELEQQYRSTQDRDIWIQLITRLSKEFNYNQAYKELQTLDNYSIKKMNPHLVLRIVFNSDLITPGVQNKTILSNFVREFKNNKLITEKEAQRYNALLLLIQGDKTNFLLSTPAFTNTDNSEIKDLVIDIQTKAKQTTQGHDIPSYYSDGLIALSLFQHGYPFLSQQLALNILKDNPNYILPKQILAYTHMILHQRSQAQSYFTQLINNDNTNIHNYQFFAGVCSYRLGNYTDTILYLNQISSDHIISDVIRYKILAYIALKDDTNAAKQMKTLLSQSDIQNTDMILAWENMVFIPYMYGKPYTIIEKEPTILDLYIDRCQKEPFDQKICQIGKIAKDIQAQTFTYSDTYLNNIIESFPRSYIYYILWEYYTKKNKEVEAQKAFVSALSLSKDNNIKDKIIKKIKKTL